MDVIKIEKLNLLFDLENATLTITGNDVIKFKFQNRELAAIWI